MQDGLSTSPAWLQTALGWIASFVTGATIFKLVEVWLNRKKPAAELQVTEATATEITVRSHSTAGDALARMMNRLDQAQTTIDRVRGERDAWEEQYAEVFTEKVKMQRDNDKLKSENEGYEKQIKRMQRTLAEHGLNYDNTQDVPVQPLLDS